MFVTKKVVSIQIISNGRQKNLGDETENFAEIKRNITHF